MSIKSLWRGVKDRAGDIADAAAHSDWGGCLALVLIFLSIVALVFAIFTGACFFMGWLIGLVAGHFGVHQPTWVWAVVWFLIVTAFGAARGSTSTSASSDSDGKK